MKCLMVVGALVAACSGKGGDGKGGDGEAGDGKGGAPRAGDAVAPEEAAALAVAAKGLAALNDADPAHRGPLLAELLFEVCGAPCQCFGALGNAAPSEREAILAR